ncbi:hypothetical protein CKALI_07660 [Corynebacterium kalinowskii]|uniref:DivIVA domain-containing protein n=1 Tax=Corynebacterium kalinowskii TaxID=2675216 RepID=A0A6B8VLS3_9CORY|nr:DivIVA domain-containing protein [Corynebacterium kalinowskii]QGU02394.1 hypothetical protein CKALI_07660 [Corynebacterium kalinowskii]
MLTWLMYIVGLAVVVALLTVVFGKAFGRGEVMPPIVDNVSLQKLNAAALARSDFEAVRFDTVIRGYRQDQVDAVIAELTDEIRALRSVQGVKNTLKETSATEL